jgi:predicted RNase H-like nuclease
LQTKSYEDELEENDGVHQKQTVSTLLVGFDSAWTPTNAGAVVGVLRLDGGAYRELGTPLTAIYADAERILIQWQADLSPSTTIVLLDQPTIVRNALGQRPVENIVASPVSRRFGGVQPANTSRREMFGAAAPVWGFLSRFGGVPDPLTLGAGTRVFETYPVLSMIALAWMRPDDRSTGCLPKYNPSRRKTFLLSDWQHVCKHISDSFDACGLVGLARWTEVVGQHPRPRKVDQDGVDACLCLLVALHLVEQRDCLMVGNVDTGYIIVPHGEALHDELEARCAVTNRASSEWVTKFRLQTSA